MTVTHGNHDFDIGFVAGSYAASKGVECDNEECVTLEGEEFYTRAITYIVVEHQAFLAGFRAGYGCYFAGLV